jgi:hypothetical protein
MSLTIDKKNKLRLFDLAIQVLIVVIIVFDRNVKQN